MPMGYWLGKVFKGKELVKGKSHHQVSFPPAHNRTVKLSLNDLWKEEKGGVGSSLSGQNPETEVWRKSSRSTREKKWIGAQLFQFSLWTSEHATWLPRDIPQFWHLRTWRKITRGYSFPSVGDLNANTPDDRKDSSWKLDRSIQTPIEGQLKAQPNRYPMVSRRSINLWAPNSSPELTN